MGSGVAPPDPTDIHPGIWLVREGATPGPVFTAVFFGAGATLLTVATIRLRYPTQPFVAEATGRTSTS